MADVDSSAVIDSGQQQLAGVYAKALLGATTASGDTQAVLEELDSFVHDVLGRLPKLEVALSSRRLAHAERVAILDRGFVGKMSTTLLNFLKVLSTHGRLDCVRSINKAAQGLYNEQRGCIEVTVRTAETLDPAALESIRNQLRGSFGKEVDVMAHVDSDLIGGIQIRIGDTVFDGSLRSQLNRIRKESFERASQRIKTATDRFVKNE